MKKNCPAHKYPHRLPWQKKVEEEECHSHESKIMLFFHHIHCKLLGCPHRKRK
ncbi:hypothetical protein KY339_00430 [Candidatus Woesearchaeota archaeon]|nr:hypothetical protein [Candidatus Woesearchaeota archaeon]